MTSPANDRAAAIRHELAHFTGTEKYYRHGLIRNVLATEGAKAFFDLTGTYWLWDIIATELTPLMEKEGWLSITLDVKDQRAQITATDGNRETPLWTKDIEYTDCPEGRWTLYFADHVLLLPSEY